LRGEPPCSDLEASSLPRAGNISQNPELRAAA
jgi:hypothetical protein